MENIADSYRRFLEGDESGLTQIIVKKPDGYSGIEFTWTPSQEIVIQAIEEDPTIKLSQFSDTVTVAVKFKDDSTETVTMDLIFNDNGQIYAVRRGTTVTT